MATAAAVQQVSPEGQPRLRSLYASLDYQCDVNRILRAMFPERTGPVMAPAELKAIDAAWHEGKTARQFAAQVVAGRFRAAVEKEQAAMYTSEPLPGIQSPFYAGDRYYADAEDARRARMEGSR